MVSDNLSRRRFLSKTGKIAVGTAGLTGMVSAAPVRAGANEKVRLGLIGCGSRGSRNLYMMLKDNAQCVALADPDDQHSGTTADKVAELQGKRPAIYRDYHKLLGHKDIDAVLVSTPDHWHAICAIEACMADKDVFVEKPVSHNIREGRAMVKAARKYNRLMFVGTQQRSADHFLGAKKYIDSGKLGKISMCRAWILSNIKSLGFPPDTDPPPHVDYNLWLGPARERRFNPNRFHWNWRWHWDYAGGQQADWGIHLIDIIQWYMGVNAPVSVSSSGAMRVLEQNTETPDTQATIFNYSDFDLVYEHRQACARPIENRGHGMAFYGQNATLVITRGEWEVYAEEQKVVKPEKVKGGSDQNMFVVHAQHFLRCVKRLEKPNADIEVGHRSTTTCQLANISMLVGRKIVWDAQKEIVVDDRKANRFLKREYRKPWVLPEV